MWHVVWFEECQAADAPVLGGKASSLVALLAAGLPVPPGFAVSATGYRTTLAAGGLDRTLAALVSAVDPGDTGVLAQTGGTPCALIAGADLPPGLCEAIGSAYAALCVLCETGAVPVAVRSSATCEDQPDASFAGEHDTYLWVRGGDAVVDGVLRCWASLFTDRGISYRRSMGYVGAGVAMAVVVQQMVLPRAAGVAFTLNPLDGDRSQVAVDACWGFGEAVASRLGHAGQLSGSTR